MGTQRFLLLHLLETPWHQSNPVIAFERTHPLALEMGRPFVKKGPSASTAHQQLLHKGCHVLPLLAPGPGSTLQLAPCLPAITTNHLTFQLVAQSLVWRQKEEGDYAGRKNEGLLQALCCPLVLVSSSSRSPSLCPCGYTFGNMAGLLPKTMRTPKSASPTLEGCASPSLDRGSEQPWWLPVLGSSATRKQARVPDWESQQTFLSFLLSPCAAPWL